MMDKEREKMVEKQKLIRIETKFDRIVYRLKIIDNNKIYIEKQRTRINENHHHN